MGIYGQIRQSMPLLEHFTEYISSCLNKGVTDVYGLGSINIVSISMDNTMQHLVIYI